MRHSSQTRSSTVFRLDGSIARLHYKPWKRDKLGVADENGAYVVTAATSRGKAKIARVEYEFSLEHGTRKPSPWFEVDSHTIVEMMKFKEWIVSGNYLSNLMMS